MHRIKDTDYLHISTRIKVVENRMMGKETFNKMLDAPNAASAFTIMCGALSAENFKDIAPHMFETVLKSEEKKVSDFLSQAVDDKALTDIFRLRWDFMNIKALIKAELLGISADSMLFVGGTVPVEEIKRAFLERSKTALDGRLLSVCEAAFDEMSRTGDPQLIDIIADKACYEYMETKAKASGFDFIGDYITAKIDITNILSFIRQRLMNRTLSQFERTVLPSPSGLDAELFAEFYEKPLDEFLAKIRNTAYSSVVEGLDSENISLTALEVAADRCMNGFVRKMRKIPFGPQVVSGYYLAKEAELKNARIVMTGKLNGENTETIRERMRLGYE